MENSLKAQTASFEARPGNVNKVVFLFSGGLDTSILVKWIQDKYGAEVITLTLDLGQPNIDVDKVKKKALKIGAKEAYVIDAKDEFAEEYISKAIKANAMYQGQYPLSTALGRPLMAKHAVELAKKIGADAIGHGCTGKGNDQVRVDSGVLTLAPEMKLLVPVRDWNLTRDFELEYAKENGIEVPNTADSPYSTDENMWGKSTECGILEYPEEEPPKDIFKICTIPEEAADEAAYIDIGFEAGVPTSLNKIKMPLTELILKLDKIAGKHGIGIIDMTEDRVIGLKSREIYECPAAIAILTAHRDLEKFVSTFEQNSFKTIIDQKWSELVYQGKWFEPLMHSLNAYIQKANEKVTGTVKLKLYKGNAIVVGRESDNAIYDLKLASYNKGHTFNQAASPGFIELASLQAKIANNKKKEEKAATHIESAKQELAVSHQ